MHQQLRQQPLIIFPIPYRIHRVIPQMQGLKLCVCGIFVFGQTQQIVGRHTVEFRQRHDGKGAYVFEILGFIFAKGGFGKARLLRKLFQAQAPVNDPQVFQTLLYRQLRFHRRLRP